MRSGPMSVGSVPNTDPTVKRSSGESVWISTTTSPWTPCVRITRPTTSCMALPLVGVNDVDSDATATDRGDHLPQRLGRTAAATDDGPQVVGVHPDLEPLAAPAVNHPYPHLVRVLDDALDQV